MSNIEDIYRTYAKNGAPLVKKLLAMWLNKKYSVEASFHFLKLLIMTEISKERRKGQEKEKVGHFYTSFEKGCMCGGGVSSLSRLTDQPPLFGL